jgi:hypothetical protein
MNTTAARFTVEHKGRAHGFATLPAAKACADKVFAQTGVALGITPAFLIRDNAGRGYLAANASTSFDLPRNWTTARRARLFATFDEASAHAQAFFRAGFVRIEAAQ